MDKFHFFMIFFVTISNIPDVILGQTAKSNQVSVVFQNDGLLSTESYLKYLKNFPELQNISVCFKIKMKQERSFNPILTYATDDFDNELLIAFRDTDLRVYCCNSYSLVITVPWSLKLMEWISVCIAMNLKNKFFESVINGVYSNQSIISDQDLLIRSGGEMYFAQEQDYNGGGFSLTQSVRGQIANFFLFNSIISKDEMLSYTDCKFDHFSVESVIDFNNLMEDFEQSKVIVKYDLENDNPCKEVLTRTIILTEPRNRFDAANVCHALGATLAIPLTKEENDALFKDGSNYHNECFTANTNYLWIGVMGNKTDQTFRNYLTQSILQNSFLAVNDKIGDRACTSMFASRKDIPLWFGRWSLDMCSSEKCTPCTFQDIKILRMRGLCLQSSFDRTYFAYQFGKNFTILGTMNSMISKVASQNRSNDYGYWEMKSFNKPFTLGILPLKTPIDYPTGRNLWSIKKDKCGKELMTLALTICKLGQFSCSDGSCIPLKNRCDLQIDCEDGSDEDDCKPLVLPSEYSRSISPPRESSSSPLKILINIEVYSIISFELSKFSFTTDIEVTMTWKDDRLKYKNLKKSLNLNNIDSESLLPWLPKYEILGGGNTSSNFKERKFILMAKRLSDPLPDDDQNVGEDEYFSGELNYLVMVKKMTIGSSCLFDLSYFPFDTQICNMIFLMSDTTSQYAELNSDGAFYSGNRKLSEYFVVSVEMFNFTRGLYSGKRVQLTFDNLVTYYVTSAYIPALIMLIIGCSTFYFPLSDFQDRVMIAITALLVDAAFFTQVSSSIPKTAYLKLIDVWFVFCIIVLFLVILALTTINFFYCFNECPLVVRVAHEKNRLLEKVAWKSQGEPNYVIKAIRMNRFFAILFPASLMVFITIYFILAVVQ